LSEDPLSQLELFVDQLLESLGELGQESAQLKRKNAELLEELEEVRQKCLVDGQEIENLQRDRRKIRLRIDRIREHISNLEEAGNRN
jgi:chromosome segregation ATPase